jgi:hypothetical protein
MQADPDDLVVPIAGYRRFPMQVSACSSMLEHHVDRDC